MKKIIKEFIVSYTAESSTQSLFEWGILQKHPTWQGLVVGLYP